jgi:hypothetical protein
MTTRTVTIFIGRWNDRDYAFSLEKERTRSLVNSHFAFGDPSVDEYAVGNRWSTNDQDFGWRIVECEVTVPVIHVELKTSEDEETSHLVWRCPCCRQARSEGWEASDTLPVLLGCGCENASKFLLGVTADVSGNMSRTCSQTPLRECFDGPPDPQSMGRVQIKTRKWTEVSGGVMTAERIRQLFQPSHEFRISKYEYPARTEFPGVMRSAMCFLLCGSCRYDFESASVTLAAGEVCDLPSGAYNLKVLGDEGVTIVQVWNLTELVDRMAHPGGTP